MQGLSRDVLVSLLELGLVEMYKSTSRMRQPCLPPITCSFSDHQQSMTLLAESLVLAHEVYVLRNRELCTGLLLKVVRQPSAENDGILVSALEMQESCTVSALSPSQLDALRAAVGLPPSSMARRPRLPAGLQRGISAVAPVVLKIRELIATGLAVEYRRGKMKAAVKALYSALSLANTCLWTRL